MKRPSIREKIPAYLHPFIAEQDSSLYTPMDHAGWRYILRVSRAYFAKHAHHKYLDGLAETGIEVERIPLISEMDAKLERFGWRAVPIVGFIPPAVFMEFLSLGVLPIACDIRTHEHLAYTPAPDIVHEAAGHAPIIADPKYADYLFAYGEIARKVIYSYQDIDVYEAIRRLSDTKEDPKSTGSDVDAAEAHLRQTLASHTELSEATLLSRMGWWTFEYGLIEEKGALKIYGAGLLSSVGESQSCLGPHVRKVPFSVRCIDTNYDITKPQPQLFVTRSFSELEEELQKLGDTMSYRRGGLYGLETARRGATVTTTELDSGVQIGGIVDEILVDALGEPIYVRWRGACQLAVGEKQLEGQGVSRHPQGFGTPIGKLKGQDRGLAGMSAAQIRALGRRIEFASGVVLEGDVVDTIAELGRNQIVTFLNCTVRWGDRVLFDPAWGEYDLACGERVVSVFGGAPDRGAYLRDTGGFSQKPVYPKTNLTAENKHLNSLYAEVRKAREQEPAKRNQEALRAVHRELKSKYPRDWLLRLELVELGVPFKVELYAELDQISREDAEKGRLIARGLALV